MSVSDASNSHENIRILIVDDDPFVRTSLSTILTAQADIEVSGEGSNGVEAQSLYAKIRPDILLMDIQMPQCNGLEAAEKIIHQHPQARIIVLTTFSDDEYIVAALRLGVRGYLVKQEVANIAPAIRSVFAGQMVLGGEIVGRVDSLMDNTVRLDHTSEMRQKKAISKGLSVREFEIIERIAQGLDNKEVAAAIYISEGTVRNHVSNILQRLGLKNRTQLAVYYYQKLN